MKAHFIDIDIILKVHSKVWVISKEKPSIPILKISKSDFNLMRTGVYKRYNNSITFNDEIYWLSDTLYNNIKIKSKNMNIDISSITFSMCEFNDVNIIDKLEYDINIDNIIDIKNTYDDIYLICSRNSKAKYDVIISKLEDKLKENGLHIKNYYFVSETFYNRNSDDIAYKKIRLLLQHIVGYKSDGDKFINHELDKYDEIYLYDDDKSTIKLCENSNRLLNRMIENSDDFISTIIKNNIQKSNHKIISCFYTSNKVNLYVKNEVDIIINNIIKTFEQFRYEK